MDAQEAKKLNEEYADKILVRVLRNIDLYASMGHTRALVECRCMSKKQRKRLKDDLEYRKFKVKLSLLDSAMDFCWTYKVSW